jgi:hypothetical protein
MVSLEFLTFQPIWVGGCVGARSRLEVFTKRKISCAYRETNHDLFIS